MEALSPEETRKVELSLAQYPGVKQELLLIREGLTLFASTHELKPKENLKHKVLSACPFEDTEIDLPNVTDEQTKLPNAKIIPLKSDLNKWLAVASIALLISSSWLVYRYTQYSKRIAIFET
jgi:hypothetical protein